MRNFAEKYVYTMINEILLINCYISMKPSSMHEQVIPEYIWNAINEEESMNETEQMRLTSCLRIKSETSDIRFTHLDKKNMTWEQIDHYDRLKNMVEEGRANKVFSVNFSLKFFKGFSLEKHNYRKIINGKLILQNNPDKNHTMKTKRLMYNAVIRLTSFLILNDLYKDINPQRINSLYKDMFTKTITCDKELRYWLTSLMVYM